MKRCGRLGLLTTCILLLAFNEAAATEITVSEGTNIAVALSPDQQQLVIDLQGMLWLVPVTGGPLRPLTDALGDDRMPRWSPDGNRLAFQSFRNGDWNIWMINPDGTGLLAVTEGAQDDRDPAWSADGERILFASDRAGNYDIWSVDIGSGELKQLTNDPAEDYAPAVSADGAMLAFVSERSGKPALYVKTGDDEPRLIAEAGANNLHAPAFDPTGQRIAFVAASRQLMFPGISLNELIVSDLTTLEQTLVSDAGEDVFRFAPAWLADDTLIYTADGLIKRRRIGSGDPNNAETIPFTARLSLEVADYPRRSPLHSSQTGQSEQPVLGIVAPVTSPDGSRVIFTALGDLWMRDRDGRIERLTDDQFVERDANFSLDGDSLAFISDRSGSMQIWLRDLATGQDHEITTRSPGPRYPTFNRDGTQLAYQQVGPRGMQDFTVHVLNLDSGETRRIKQAPPLWPGPMSWSADSKHLTVAALTKRSKRFRGGVNQLVRLDIDADTATVNALPATQFADFGPAGSPDGTLTALIIDGALWTVPTAADGSFTGPPERLLDELVDYPSFSADPVAITFLSTRGLEQITLGNKRRSRLPIDLSWQEASPTGTQIVHAGRLFDGENSDYQRDVDIVIRNNRISEVRQHHDHPADIKIFDASNKTVLPGLIDHHMHFQPHEGEWVGRAWLAFGVTSVVEPGGMPYQSREIMEAWASGRRDGPRLVFSGPQLDGKRRHFHFASHINSDQRLAWEMQRAKTLGYGFIKTYTRMPADRQQKAIAAAHELGIPVTAHAAFRTTAFGGDRVEHLRGTSRLGYSDKQSEALRTYDDFVQIVGANGATITPTVAVAGGFFDYYLKHPELAENLQFTSLYPEAYRRGLNGFARMIGKNQALLEGGLANVQATIRSLHAGGATIVAGTDSPIFPYGLTLITEIINFEQAGLQPFEALQTATSKAAMAMGAGDELGVIQAGMLADLVIVDGDPLSDLSDLFNVTGVMTNGRYYRLDDLLHTNE